jgi:hypothetical protein
MASNEFNNYANREIGLATTAANMATGQGQSLGSLYMGRAQGMAGLLAPQQQGPNGVQQLAGLGAMAAGTYFGGPAGGAAAKKAVDTTTQPQPVK